MPSGVVRPQRARRLALLATPALLALLALLANPDTLSARTSGGAPPAGPGAAQEETDHPDQAVCRVCAARSTHGEDPDPEDVAGVSFHDGVPYYFCSKDCQREFDASPGWWAPLELPFQVPDLRVRNLDGEVVPLEVGGGRLTILDFWATWCQPCRSTMRALQERFERAGTDLRIVGVSTDEGDGALRKVRRYVRSEDISYPIVLDDQETPAWVALKVYAVPTIMLVDREGRVVWRYTGPDGDDRLDAALTELEKAPSP